MAMLRLALSLAPSPVLDCRVSSPLVAGSLRWHGVAATRRSAQPYSLPTAIKKNAIYIGRNGRLEKVFVLTPAVKVPKDVPLIESFEQPMRAQLSARIFLGLNGLFSAKRSKSNRLPKMPTT
jgi:hypothetical protein